MTAAAVLQHAHVLDPAAMRAARRAAGVSLDVAGARVCRDRAHIAKYERGVIDPPASILGALAGLYGVEVSAFYRRDPQAR
jgi:transcriptional regulator with XRE-family HTH domain